ncbi:twin-arginine translocase subunit TatC [Halalkalicoccus sp. GCM10025322]|uniref:twin-arginine translocase subunit TatC n=1 Tax=Halalkalicoccus TaxID=332246 RepID=UPI002F962EF6
MSSSIVDEDTARSLNTGKETVGAVLSTIQSHLQKVFIIFVVGFLGTFYALRAYVWDWLKWVTESEMPPEVAEQHEIIVQTPFEVILLQAKIGIVAGILVSLPPLLYLSRHELRARGFWPQTPVARWKAVSLALFSLALFMGGVVYAFAVFFPLILGFLAEFSLGVGVTPTWSIVMWTEFLVLLTISFGLAAQLPLAMSSLAYIEVVPYETFRDKWRYAILGIFVFGALFSPPDPISQIMWALPLIVLYGFSLGLTRFIVNIKRGGRAEIGPAFRRNAGKLVGGPLLLAAATYAVLVSGVGEYLRDRLLAPRGIALPEALWLQETLGVSREIALALGAASAVFLLTLAVLALYYLFSSVNTERPAAGGRMGEPSEIDLEPLDAAGIRAAPDAAFESLSEERALDLARSAIDDGEGEKAEAILERFDAVHEGDADADADASTSESATGAEDSDADEGGVVQETATGMFAAFTDERDEDDIGGYIYDIKYIADSLQSRLLRIFAVFGLVLTGTFTFFYLGGVRVITKDFVSRMPASIVTVEDFRIIDLHPVETLIFIIKVSTMLAVLAVLPMLLYYAWPAMKERGLTVGQRSVVFEWTVAFVLALAGGTLLGYYYIAPGLIGFLVYDASRAGMVISYRISKFSWLIIYTTVGVGLLACVPVTMWMLFRGKLASFRTMRNRWREVTIAVFAVAGVFTPVSVLTMFLVAIPTMLAYGVGLAGLWAVTLGGRRDYAPPEERTASDDGNARWLALIVAVLVLVGIGVAVTGGISAVVDDDAFGTDDAPGEPAGNASNESVNESPADANETGATESSESNESNESTDAEPADETAEPNESDADEEPAGSDAEENATDENATEDDADAADEDADAADEETNDTERDDEEDDESEIDIREPIDD